MERKIQIGDLVYLKSGGPVMTVARRNYEDTVFICACFDGAVLHEVLAHPDALEKVEQPVQKAAKVAW